MIYYSGESSIFAVIMTLICFWYLFKVYAPKIEKEKNIKQEIININLDDKKDELIKDYLNSYNYKKY